MAYPQRKDPLTGKLFYPIRSNQMFANRTNQVRWNNIKAKKKRDIKAPLNQTLDSNRNILKRVLAGKKKITKTKEFMLGAGYSFGNYCQVYKSGGLLYQYVYDFAIADKQDGNYVLIDLKQY
jgi:hypothetical protein